MDYFWRISRILGFPVKYHNILQLCEIYGFIDSFPFSNMRDCY